MSNNGNNDTGDNDLYDLMARGAACRVVVVGGKGYCPDADCKPTRDIDGTWMHSVECHVPAMRQWVRDHRRRANQHLRDDWEAK